MAEPTLDLRVHNSHLMSVDLSGRTLVAAGHDCVINVVDLDERKLLRNLQGHLGQVVTVKFFDGNKRAISGSFVSKEREERREKRKKKRERERTKKREREFITFFFFFFKGCDSSYLGYRNCQNHQHFKRSCKLTPLVSISFFVHSIFFVGKLDLVCRS
jgi:hypothetical protein